MSQDQLMLLLIIIASSLIFWLILFISIILYIVAKWKSFKKWLESVLARSRLSQKVVDEEAYSGSN